LIRVCFRGGATVLEGIPLITSMLPQMPAVAGSFRVDLPPHRFAEQLRPTSPFGINTALRPGASDVEALLKLMQEAGIKWGRQDLT
jgi:hypothetical protein